MLTPELIKTRTVSNIYTSSYRMIATPSSVAKSTFFYVQEVGYLSSIKAHRSSRKSLDSYLFLYVLSGSGEICIRNEVHSLRAGDCVFLDCRDSYYHESSEQDPWELLWVHFDGATTKQYYEQYCEDTPFVTHPVHNDFYINLIMELMELHDRKPPNFEIESSCKLVQLLTRLLQIRLDDSLFCETLETEGQMTQKLRAVRTYLDEHFTEEITLDMLSRRFSVSKFYLCREFKERFTYSILNYITAKRVNYAKELLRFSSRSVQEIAFLCGIEDSNYFNKVFKKAEGVTPTEYRTHWAESTKDSGVIRKKGLEERHHDKKED